MNSGSCIRTTRPWWITTEACGNWACPEYYEPVCANNGVTYSNVCFFNSARDCDYGLEIVSQGVCPTTTKSPRCDNWVCTKEFSPVCLSNRQVFFNKCLYERWVECERTDYKPAPVIVHDGACIGHEYCGTWVCERDETPVCGTDGRTYRNMCELQRNKDCDSSIGFNYDGVCKTETTSLSPVTNEPIETTIASSTKKIIESTFV